MLEIKAGFFYKQNMDSTAEPLPSYGVFTDAAKCIGIPPLFQSVGVKNVRCRLLVAVSTYFIAS